MYSSRMPPLSLRIEFKFGCDMSNLMTVMNYLFSGVDFNKWINQLVEF